MGELLPSKNADATDAERIFEMMTYRGCPICRILAKDEFDYICDLQGDIHARKEVRAQIIDRGGICNFHMWNLQEMVTSHTIAYLCRDMLDRLIAWCKADEAEGEGRSAARLIRAPYAYTKGCFVCRYNTRRERECTEAFLQEITKEEFQGRYASRKGLCLPHLARALRAATEPSIRVFLAKLQIQQMEALRRAIQGFSISSYRHVPDEAKDNLRTAMQRFVGTKGMEPSADGFGHGSKTEG